MRFSRFVVILTAFLVTACSDAPTGGEHLSAADLQRLARIEASEQQRVALIAAQSDAVFDSLEAEFLLSGLLGGTTDVLTGMVGGTTDLLSDVLGLLLCHPERYAATVKVVGRQGGVVQVGAHRLEIPRNALSAPTVITAERPTERAATVRFSPHGLEFERSATLTMDYGHCRDTPRRKRMAYTDEQLNILELPISRDDPLNQQVEAKIDHFSRYAVAY